MRRRIKFTVAEADSQADPMPPFEARRNRVDGEDTAEITCFVDGDGDALEIIQAHWPKASEIEEHEIPAGWRHDALPV